ncbi:MAG: hypothetical protein IJP31_04680 [Lachnospiraceae bacterium]|nr:hypothetical protein [Lachnospiraceae bacterium]
MKNKEQLLQIWKSSTTEKRFLIHYSQIILDLTAFAYILIILDSIVEWIVEQVMNGLDLITTSVLWVLAAFIALLVLPALFILIVPFPDFWNG